MRVAQRAHQWNNGGATISEQLVKFKERKSKISQKDRDAAIARSKAVWMGGVKAAQQNIMDKRHGN